MTQVSNWTVENDMKDSSLIRRPIPNVNGYKAAKAAIEELISCQSKIEISGELIGHSK